MILQETPAVDDHINPVCPGDVKTLNPPGYREHERQEMTAANDNADPVLFKDFTTLPAQDYHKHEVQDTAVVVVVTNHDDPVRPKDLIASFSSDYHEHESQGTAIAIVNDHADSVRPENFITPHPPDYHECENQETAIAIVNDHADSVRPENFITQLPPDYHEHESRETAEAVVNDHADSVRPENFITPLPPDYHERESQETAAIVVVNDHADPVCTEDLVTLPPPDYHKHEVQDTAIVAVNNHADSVRPEGFISPLPRGYHQQESQETAVVNDHFHLYCYEDISSLLPPDYHEHESQETAVVVNDHVDSVYPEDFITPHPSGHHVHESQETARVNNHTDHDRPGNELTPPPLNHDHEYQETPEVVNDHHSDPVLPTDITPLPLPPDCYEHESQETPIAYEPYVYFSLFFTEDIIDYIVCQVNTQQNSIIINADDFKVFVGALIRMSVYPRPHMYNYWSRLKKYRVKEVVEHIDRHSFVRIKVALPFNDSKPDRRHDEILYIYKKMNEEFLTVPATPLNSVFEIPDKRNAQGRSKLFCRSSTDGFIHDVFMSQGDRVFENHHTQLDDEERDMMYQDKIATVLIKTLEDTENSTVYTYRMKTTNKLIHHLRSRYGCRYIPIEPVPRSSAYYQKSLDGILKYKTPLHKKNYRMDLFGYAIDLCVHNAWILYKRNCISLDVQPMSNKEFRLKISEAYLIKKVNLSSVKRYNRGTSKMKVCYPKLEEQHLPQHVAIVLMCTNCCSRESHWMCEHCGVTLCISEKRNCFREFHKALVYSTST
uniref:PiggyBac transposable element-like protein n=1 Tax=Penaeus monodon majanivirus B TaxID=2984272 RepID=A0A9C7C586_9VIRU|nr:MAG: piggyBac transposable element-like protein [Penaeus monodon majanivirus B]